MSARRSSAIAAIVATLSACGKGESTPSTSSAQAPTTAATPAVGNLCPATGLWAQCSVMYRLQRSGLVATLDSTDTKPEEALLAGQMFVLKLGQSRLEVYLYPDTAARAADGKKLDRTRFISESTTLTIKRERTLIESANLIGLLSSLSSHQRERVSDAITAGPPQPAAR